MAPYWVGRFKRVRLFWSECRRRLSCGFGRGVMIEGAPLDGDGFERSRQRLEALVSSLADPAAGEATHPQLEDQLAASGRELVRSLLQDHLDLRAVREDKSPDVTGADGLAGTRGGERSQT